MNAEFRKEYNEKYRRTISGVISTIYHGQMSGCKNRGLDLPKYNLKELKDWILCQSNFNELYETWVNSNYNIDFKPSVDRLDDYKGYTFDNIRLITFKENRRSGDLDRINGINNKLSKAVCKYDMNGNLVKEYYSINSAARENNIKGSDIIKVCANNRRHHKGYIWKYKGESSDCVVKIRSHKNSKKVGMFSFDGVLVNEFDSAALAIKETGLKSIYQVLCGNYNNTGGYIWKYLSN